MIRALLLFSFLFYTHHLLAQVQWAHHLNSSPSYNAYTFHEQFSVDTEGNIVSVGYFKGKLKLGSFELDKEGTAANTMPDVKPDIFVYKASPSGEILWAKQFQSAGGAGDAGVSVDSDGNIYIAGGFIKELVLEGNKSITGNDRWNVFLCKLDKHGKLLWVNTMSGKNELSEARTFGVVSANAKGDVALAFNYSGSVGLDSLELSNIGQAGNNLVVAKLSTDGDLTWYSNPSAETNTEARDMWLNDAGEVYLTGAYTSNVTFGKTTLTTSYYGYGDIFLCKINKTGSCAWATAFNKTVPGELNNTGKAIGIDPVTGEIYLSGSFKGNVKFGGSVISGEYTSEDPGNADIFLTKLTPDGAVLWAKRLGSAGHDFVNDINIAASGAVTIAGAWNNNPFLSTYSRDGEMLLEVPFRTLGSGYATGVAALPEQSYYVSGVYSTTLYIWDRQWPTWGQRDSFLMRLTYIQATGSQPGNCQSHINQPANPILQYQCKSISVLNKADNTIKWYLNGELLPNENAVDLTVKENGEYKVEFENECGTSTSKILVGELKEQYQSYNVMTPNGDGKNDRFFIDPALVGSSLQIFSRWGKAVYETDSYKNDWEAEGVPSGIYYWLIVNECQEKLTGTVTIIR